jgi:hypothetical protein
MMLPSFFKMMRWVASVLMPVHQLSSQLGVPDQKIWGTIKMYTDIISCVAKFIGNYLGIKKMPK